MAVFYEDLSRLASVLKYLGRVYYIVGLKMPQTEGVVEPGVGAADHDRGLLLSGRVWMGGGPEMWP